MDNVNETIIETNSRSEEALHRKNVIAMAASLLGTPSLALCFLLPGSLGKPVANAVSEVGPPPRRSLNEHR
jgi:hypothetical protein